MGNLQTWDLRSSKFAELRITMHNAVTRIHKARNWLSSGHCTQKNKKFIISHKEFNRLETNESLKKKKTKTWTICATWTYEIQLCKCWSNILLLVICVIYNFSTSLRVSRIWGHCYDHNNSDHFIGATTFVILYSLLSSWDFLEQINFKSPRFDVSKIYSIHLAKISSVSQLVFSFWFSFFVKWITDE